MASNLNNLASWHLRKLGQKQRKSSSFIRSLANVPSSFSVRSNLASSDSDSLTLPLIATAKAAPDLPPPSVRLRRWLKAGKRFYGVEVRWQEGGKP